ncbi:MAG: hypothetical protein ACRDI3_05915 [Actinomycetota bacterium]
MRIGSAVLVALALAACKPDTLALDYHFTEGSTITYRMEAHAEARWQISSKGSGSYDVSFDVTETIRSADEKGATVEVQMTPLDAREEGLPSPGLETRSFSLELSPSGEVLRVLDVNGITATALDPEEVAFIGTYRPALPEDPVHLHDSWSATQELTTGVAPQQLATIGVLDALGRDGRGDLAYIDFDGEGSLLWSTRLPQGDASLDGAATTNGRAVVDIEGGFLRKASSTTSGDFDVRIASSGGRAPIGGTLHLELELTIRQTSRD